VLNYTVVSLPNGTQCCDCVCACVFVTLDFQAVVSHSTVLAYEPKDNDTLQLPCCLISRSVCAKHEAPTAHHSHPLINGAEQQRSVHNILKIQHPPQNPAFPNYIQFSVVYWICQRMKKVAVRTHRPLIPSARNRVA
jgi:hypothetical protein